MACINVATSLPGHTLTPTTRVQGTVAGNRSDVNTWTTLEASLPSAPWERARRYCDASLCSAPARGIGAALLRRVLTGVPLSRRLTIKIGRNGLLHSPN